MVKVLVVDDHAMFRTGVRAELAAQPGIEVVADAEDVDTAVAAIAAHRPEVVLLDVHLPGGGGVEVMRRMPPRRNRQRPRNRSIFRTSARSRPSTVSSSRLTSRTSTTTR